MEEKVMEFISKNYGLFSKRVAFYGVPKEDLIQDLWLIILQDEEILNQVLNDDSFVQHKISDELRKEAVKYSMFGARIDCRRDIKKIDGIEIEIFEKDERNTRYGINNVERDIFIDEMCDNLTKDERDFVNCVCENGYRYTSTRYKIEESSVRSQFTRLMQRLGKRK